MNKPFISLCPEITRDHAFTLMDWLEDEDVTRYLSDSRHVSRFIEQLVGRVQLPILTHLFNQGGRFFMACDQHDVPVGFVRIIKTGPDCEMVLVIGDRTNWGRHLGTSTLREAMKLAFFDMGAEKLIAKIHADNTRSLKTFQRGGFQLASETPTLKTFAALREHCLALLREDPATDPATIYITEIDRIRLRSLIAREPGHVDLAHEVERAVVVAPQQVARDVVTMNSRARLRLDDEDLEVTLVYPQDADGSRSRLSICSPIGTAILGYREGDVIDWRVPDRTCRVQIGKLLYQPEAAGDFHL